jgi:hypothetical protein
MSIAMSRSYTRALAPHARSGDDRLMRAGEIRWMRTVHDARVVSVDASPDGTKIASTDTSGGLMVHDRDTGKTIATEKDATGHVPRVRFADADRVVVSMFAQGTWGLRLLSSALASVTHVKGDSTLREDLLSFDVGADGRIAISTNEHVNPNWDEHRGRVWILSPKLDLPRAPALVFEDTRGGDVAWLGPARVATSFGYGSSIEVWDLDPCAKIADHAAGGWRSTMRGLSPDRFACWRESETLRVFHVGEAEPDLELAVEAVPSAASTSALAVVRGSRIEVLALDGAAQWGVEVAGTLSACSFAGDALVVGLDDGRVGRASPS